MLSCSEQVFCPFKTASCLGVSREVAPGSQKHERTLDGTNGQHGRKRRADAEKGAVRGLSACLLSGVGLCTRIRTAGQAETGTASSVRNASGHWTSSFLSAMVDGQARWLKEESPGFIQGSVNLQGL